MPVRLLTIFAFALVFAHAPHHAAAQGSDYGFRDIMVEEGGRPLKRSRTSDPKLDADPKRKPERKERPRGSGYVPNTGLPRTDAVRVAPSGPGPYTPPPINSFGDRVIGCNHSYPLNAGIGNNPLDRGSYVRQCAN